jgi:nucleotide-binding universal stress UspA family protein
VIVGHILVGVDGSKESAEALRWAVDETRLRETTLVVLYAYGPLDDHDPYVRSYAFTPDADTAHRLASSEQRLRTERAISAKDAAEHLLGRAIADAVGHVGDVRIEAVVAAETRPARALIERSGDAELLVVGSRGRGGFAGLLLGSVSQQCAQHANCPVVVVRSH